MHERILILDFGGQYSHLIASRIRRFSVLAEIFNPDDPQVFETIKSPLENGDLGGCVKGIILSGGPQSVFEEGAPQVDPQIFDLNIPVLGICYGHQFMNYALGGHVEPGEVKEYGRADLTHTDHCPLFKNIPQKSTFWMSHGDEVTALPEGFRSVGHSENCENAAVWHADKNLFGIQFHPEVTHSEFGTQVLENFVKNICQAQGDWTIEKFFQEHERSLIKTVGDKNVFLFVSGGVDSTVVFAFLTKILGPGRVRGIFVDTGMMRQGEVEFVEKALHDIGADLTVLREAETFLGNLEGVADPEKKRAIIGNTFLEVQRKFFEKEKIDTDQWLLAQGTIYPDTIESGGTKNSSKIKTHHNRVPEIQKLIDEGFVIEPVAELYKDEVRNLGRLLKLPDNLVDRHPFPGPGLGVRILCAPEDKSDQLISRSTDQQIRYTTLPIKSVGVQGDFRTYRHPAVIKSESFSISELEKQATELINANEEINRALFCIDKTVETFESCTIQKSFMTSNRVTTLQQADNIVTKHFEALPDSEKSKIWQFPVVLVPMSFNGTGRESIILRPINSVDAMSASVGNLSQEFFQACATEILKNENISAVFLDITSKPPGTIEWE